MTKPVLDKEPDGLEFSLGYSLSLFLSITLFTPSYVEFHSHVMSGERGSSRSFAPVPNDEPGTRDHPYVGNRRPEPRFSLYPGGWMSQSTSNETGSCRNDDYQTVNFFYFSTPVPQTPTSLDINVVTRDRIRCLVLG